MEALDAWLNAPYVRWFNCFVVQCHPDSWPDTSDTATFSRLDFCLSTFAWLLGDEVRTHKSILQVIHVTQYISTQEFRVYMDTLILGTGMVDLPLQRVSLSHWDRVWNPGSDFSVFTLLNT